MTKEKVTEYKGRFEIDTDGFKNQMATMEPWRLLQEIISNSLDEDKVRKIIVTIEYDPEIKKVKVKVLDDGGGFETIKDVFTMFRRSYKAKFKNKRGKFNLGEKEFIAVTVTSKVRSRDWQQEFYDDKRRETLNMKYFKGTEISAVFDWTKEQLFEIFIGLDRIIVPQDKILLINDKEVSHKNQLRSIIGKLKTEIEDERTKKMLTRTEETDIDIYEKQDDEIAWLYDQGIPVQQFEEGLSFPWHIDIQQKIPVGIKRDTVSDAYFVDLYSILVTQCLDLVPDEGVGEKWINRSMIKIDSETAKEVFKRQYGTDQIYVPSTDDYNANESVNDVGGEFVKPRTLGKDEKKHLEKIGALKYAHKEFPTGDAKEYKVVVATEAMIKYAKIVKLIAKDCIKKDIDIVFCRSDSTHPAWYGMNTLTYNLRLLSGKKFFNSFSIYGIGLIVHELSHDKAPNEQEYPMPHSSKEFLREFQRIAGMIGFNGIKHWEIKYSEVFLKELKSK